MLNKHVGTVKKDVEFLNGKRQTIRLINQIQFDLHEQDSKSSQKRNTLQDFRDKTDSSLSQMIYSKKYVPTEQGWKVKHAISRSLRTKLYHAEIINTKAKK
jgi:hypothetical protein